MKITRRFALIVAASISLLATACSKARLTTTESPRPVEQFSLNAKFCSKFGRTNSQPLKVIFVVDMSMSNIGKFVGSKFDSSFGTDLLEARFDAANQFVTDCGSQNSNNEYSVIGFSNGIISVNGAEVCSSPFVKTAGEAKNIVEALRQIQKDNVTHYSTSPTVAKDMTETDYSKAIDCLQTKITSDLQKNSGQQPFYQVFFMTDGKPNPDPCSGRPECYKTKIELLSVQAATASSAIKFQPIFYGKSDDKAQALKILDPMAEAGKVDQVQVVDDIKNIKLCELTSKPISVRYRKESLNVTNLTAKMERGQLLPDSDIDGIPDELENQFGYDPIQRRTYGVMDGVCKALGGPSLCKSLQTQLNCQNKNNNLSLSDCDLRALKLDNLSTGPLDLGIDSDNDGLPDLVEILKDTLPNFDDGSSDLDGDGLTNRNEIFRGSQPNFPDRDIRKEILISLNESLTKTAPGCAVNQEAWALDLTHVPLVPVKAFKEVGSRPMNSRNDMKYLDISHEENENVILITFKSVPENDLKSKSEVWGTLIKISYDALKQKSISLNPSDFYLMGEGVQ